MKKNIRDYAKNGVQYAFILDNITNPDSEEEMTDKEKIDYFVKCFETEFNNEYNRRRYPNFADRIGQYLRGLPSCCSLPFWDDEIAKIGRKWGFCQTPSKEAKFINDYWTVCGLRIIQIDNYFRR